MKYFRDLLNIVTSTSWHIENNKFPWVEIFFIFKVEHPKYKLNELSTIIFVSESFFTSKKISSVEVAKC